MRIAVCVDGIDGAGKTTIVRKVKERLEYIFQRQPFAKGFYNDGFLNGRFVETMAFPSKLLRKDIDLTSNELSFRDFLDDFEHCFKKSYESFNIREQLFQIVLIDRSFISTMSYQGSDIIEPWVKKGGCYAEELVEHDPSFKREIFEEGFKGITKFFDKLLFVHLVPDTVGAVQNISRRVDNGKIESPDRVEKFYQDVLKEKPSDWAAKLALQRYVGALKETVSHSFSMASDDTRPPATFVGDHYKFLEYQTLGTSSIPEVVRYIEVEIWEQILK